VGGHLNVIASEQSSPTRGAVAPAWHTVAVLVWLLGFSALGALHVHWFHEGPYTGVIRYLVSIFWEWTTVGFIALSMRRGGVRLRDLIGGRWPGTFSVLRDVGLAVGFLIVSDFTLAILALALHARPSDNVVRLMPKTGLELAVFLPLCLTAGICEELIFRGYLQRQLAGLTASAGMGLVLQGVAFGAAHGYQGLKSMAIIVVFGCFFGILASWRRSIGRRDVFSGRIR
jgi:uncharacterized protein